MPMVAIATEAEIPVAMAVAMTTVAIATEAEIAVAMAGYQGELDSMRIFYTNENMRFICISFIK